MIGRVLTVAALLFSSATFVSSSAQTTAPAPEALLAADRQTYGEAMRWYEAEARRGNPRAEFLLGYMYETGLRSAPDPARARTWYEKAARQGSARAAFRLARLYQEGRGGPVDMAAALRFYRLAAERGYVPAQSMLGYLLAAGKDIPRNDAEAYLWLTLAARAGDRTATANRARLLDYLTPEARSAGEKLVRNFRPKG